MSHIPLIYGVPRSGMEYSAGLFIRGRYLQWSVAELRISRLRVSEVFIPFYRLSCRFSGDFTMFDLHRFATIQRDKNLGGVKLTFL